MQNSKIKVTVNLMGNILGTFISTVVEPPIHFLGIPAIMRETF